MKKLILIGGTMGIGKTTISQELKHLLPNSVFLDGDWCWDMSPFQVNDLTKQLVIDNISYLLNNFSSCPSFEYVICCWVMDSQDILDALEAKLKVTKEQLVTISLVCQEEQLIQRLQKDIEQQRRQPAIIPNSLARMANYEGLNTIKMEVSNLTPLEAAKTIEKLVVGKNREE